MRTVAARGEETQEIVYNYFRTYDPSTGRYLESDPIGLAAGPNTYSYVSNMPTMRADKYGLYEGGGISEVMPCYDYDDYLDAITDMEYRPPSPNESCLRRSGRWPRGKRSLKWRRVRVQPMKTFEIHSDDEGYFVAFEIENAYVRPKTVAEILTSVDGVTDMAVGKSSGESRDIRVTFNYLGIEYIVWEPYGDNSRYWIGPKQTDGQMLDTDIAPLANAFREYQPPFLVKVVGDLVTFNFKSLFKSN